MMTNAEKNEKRFDELGIGDWPDFEIAHNIAVRKNGDVDLCARISCCDCIFKCGNCLKEAEEWLLEEAEPEKPTPEKNEEKMEKDEIKVGDIVKVTAKDHIRDGEIGTVKTIRHIRIGLNKYEVSFDDNGYGNFFSKNEIKKVKPEKKDEKMKKEEIKVGDTAKVTRKGCAEEGKIGLVSRIFNISADGIKTYGVRLDGAFSECVFFESELKKVKSKKTPPRIVIYQDGDTVTAKDLETGEEESAVCSKNDTFDFYTGSFIALSRLTGHAYMLPVMMGDIELMERDLADFKNRVKAMMGDGDMWPCDVFFNEKGKK